MEIDAGIGTIYVNTDNIALQQLVEALAAALARTSPQHVTEMLEQC